MVSSVYMNLYNNTVILCTILLDHNTSFSHAIVLPPHPLTAPHSPQEPGVEDLATIFGDGGNISDTIDDNILSELRNDTFWEFDEGQLIVCMHSYLIA